MNPYMAVFIVVAWIGLPFFLVIAMGRKLLGIKNTNSGFDDLASSLGLAFYCGIATIIVAILLFSIWAMRAASLF